jgi:hypothetical protein
MEARTSERACNSRNRTLKVQFVLLSSYFRATSAIRKSFTMADLSQLPKDHYVTSMQFTKSAQQVAYPAIDPSLPQHSLNGKVAIITGASRGVGATVR